MIAAITTKIEIDVMSASDVDEAFQLAAIHKCPAVVVHQQLLEQAIVMRARRNGRFKIIAPIDWPKGETYGITKLRGMTVEMMQADGYEIMLTGDKNSNENKNEAKTLTTFIREHISPTHEIRFVLGAFTRPEKEILQICGTMTGIPAPALLRTDHHLKMPATKANAKVHNQTVEAIRTVCGLPLKVSGNIDTVKTLAGCVSGEHSANRVAVNLQQMQAIVKELRSQPDALRELLEA